MVLRAVTLVHLAAVAACFIVMAVLFAVWHDNNVKHLEKVRNAHLCSRGVQAARARVFTSVSAPVRLSNSMRLKNATSMLAGFGASPSGVVPPNIGGDGVWRKMVLVIEHTAGIDSIQEIHLSHVRNDSITTDEFVNEFGWEVHRCERQGGMMIPSAVTCSQWAVFVATTTTPSNGSAVLRSGFIRTTRWDAGSGTLLAAANASISTSSPSDVAALSLPMFACPFALGAIWASLAGVVSEGRRVPNPMNVSDEFLFTTIVDSTELAARFERTSSSDTFGCSADVRRTVENALSPFCAAAFASVAREGSLPTIMSLSVSSQPIGNTWPPPRCLAVSYNIDLGSLLIPETNGNVFADTSAALVMETSASSSLTIVASTAPGFSATFLNVVNRSRISGQHTTMPDVVVNVEATAIVDTQWYMVSFLQEKSFFARAPQLGRILCCGGGTLLFVLVVSAALQLWLLVWPVDALIRLVQEAHTGKLIDALLRTQREVCVGESSEMQEGNEDVLTTLSSGVASVPSDPSSKGSKWSFPFFTLLWRQVSPLDIIDDPRGDDEQLLTRKLVCLSVSAHYFTEIGDVVQGLVALYKRLQHVKKFAPPGVMEETFERDWAFAGNNDDHDEAPAPSLSLTSRQQPGVVSLFDDVVPPATPMGSRGERDGPRDDASTMYGMFGGSVVSSTPAPDTMSFGSSWHTFGSSFHDGSSRGDRRTNAVCRDNFFRSTVCTMMRISLSAPSLSKSRGRDRGSDADVAVMNMIVQTILDAGGVIDVLEPQHVTAYFGSQARPLPSVDVPNPLSAAEALRRPRDGDSTTGNSTATSRLHLLSSYDSADQCKSPIRALACAFLIRYKVRDFVMFAKKPLCVDMLRVFDSMSIFLDKSTFLYGNCGNKERVNRVVFQPRQERYLGAIEDLNRSTLGASMVATMRAARVIEGSLRRMGALNATVSVLPLDCLDMGHVRGGTMLRRAASVPTGLQSPNKLPALHSAAHRQSDDHGSQASPSGANSHVSYHTDNKVFMWLFSIVELGGQPSEEERSVAHLPIPDRTACVMSLYKLFHQAVTQGLDFDGDGDGSAAFAIRALSQLGAYGELVSSVQGLLLAATSGMRMHSAATGGAPVPLDPRPDKFRYCRKLKTVWRLFGLPSLEAQQLEGAEAHARLLKEYQISTAVATGGVRASIARRRAAAEERNSKLDLKKALAATTWGPHTLHTSSAPSLCSTAIVHGSSAEPSAPSVLGQPGVHGSTEDLLGCMLFDVLVPTTHALDPSVLHQQTPSLDDTGSALLSTAPSIASHETLRGELPIIIKSRNSDEIWWERSNEVLGRGSLSTVYSGRAHDTAPVALKCICITSRHAKHEILENEVNTACGLSHDHIVRYHEWVVHESFLIIIMEYVPCGSLHQRIQQHRSSSMFALPRQACVAYVKGCLCGLQYLHEKGIVHGDVKPHNMLMNHCGVIKLTDFGSVVKRCGDAGPDDDESGDNFRGTAIYTAPEVMKGDIPTPSSDLFSFGVALYELVSGGALPWESKQCGLATHDDDDGTCSTASTSVESDVATIRYAIDRPSQFIGRVADGTIGVMSSAHMHHVVASDALWLRMICACLEEDPSKRPSCAVLLEWIAESELPI